MKKWLLQTSTIGGLLALAIAGVKAAQSGADPLTIALGVLGLALALVNDGKFLKGLVPVLFVGFLATSATACAGFSLPDGVTASAAIDISCNALGQSQCFGTALSSVGINQGTCKSDISAALEGKISFNWSRAKELPRVCEQDLNAIQDYIGSVSGLKQ